MQFWAVLAMMPNLVAVVARSLLSIAGVVLLLTVLVEVAVAVSQSSHDLSDRGADQYWSEVG